MNYIGFNDEELAKKLQTEVRNYDQCLELARYMNKQQEILRCTQKEVVEMRSLIHEVNQQTILDIELQNKTTEILERDKAEKEIIIQKLGVFVQGMLKNSEEIMRGMEEINKEGEENTEYLRQHSFSGNIKLPVNEIPVVQSYDEPHADTIQVDNFAKESCYIPPILKPSTSIDRCTKDSKANSLDIGFYMGVIASTIGGLLCFNARKHVTSTALSKCITATPFVIVVGAGIMLLVSISSSAETNNSGHTL